MIHEFLPSRTVDDDNCRQCRKPFEHSNHPTFDDPARMGEVGYVQPLAYRVERYEWAIKLRASGLTLQQIADIIGVGSRQRVAQILRRPPGENGRRRKVAL